MAKDLPTNVPSESLDWNPDDFDQDLIHEGLADYFTVAGSDGAPDGALDAAALEDPDGSVKSAGTGGKKGSTKTRADVPILMQSLLKRAKKKISPTTTPAAAGSSSKPQ